MYPNLIKPYSEALLIYIQRPFANFRSFTNPQSLTLRPIRKVLVKTDIKVFKKK